MTPAPYDLLIVGGGMVGTSLALALAGRGLRLAVVEAAPFRRAAQPSYDDRAIALSQGSRRIFEAMGLWPELAPAATSIERIHVSDQGHFGITRLSAQEEGVEALGHVITGRALGEGLVQQAEGLQGVDIFSPASLRTLRLDGAQASASLEREGETITLQARLVVAADGSDSAVRRLLDIPVRGHDYGQTALVANVTPQRPHANVAYERFTPHGPLALLPLSAVDRRPRCALVWTHDPARSEQLLALDDAGFLRALQDTFGTRLGRLLTVGRRHSYPLRLLQATEQTRPRLVLIGNAAHTLHPIAGQGLNLGLRDVAALAEVVVGAVRAGRDPGDAEVLADYDQWRAADQRRVIDFTNTLVQTFSNRFPPLSLARNLGLLATDLLPPLKHRLARGAMGRSGRLPRLARGLSL